jgi:hypothetical protein
MVGKALSDERPIDDRLLKVRPLKEPLPSLNDRDDPPLDGILIERSLRLPNDRDDPSLIDDERPEE